MAAGDAFVRVSSVRSRRLQSPVYTVMVGSLVAAKLDVEAKAFL